MKKTVENDGYEAVQVGFGDVSPKGLNKPRKGHFAKAGVANKKVLDDEAARRGMGNEMGERWIFTGTKITIPAE